MRKSDYEKSAEPCPVCGKLTTMRIFKKNRGEDWVGFYALRWYCVNDKCPVDHVHTEFFTSKESAERRKKQFMRN